MLPPHTNASLQLLTEVYVHGNRRIAKINIISKQLFYEITTLTKLC